MSNATQIIDASGPAATGAGAGITLLSWIATWDLGFLIGVVIGLAGVGIQFANYTSNRQFQKRKDKREQAEEHRKQAEEHRKQELHEINMRKALEQCNAEQD
jgi:hypothetical protein